MDLEQLRCFITVADDLHFGRAAQRLGMLPATFSRQIRLLEEHLGGPLLIRTTRNVALTRGGAAFLEDARKLLQQADDVAARFRARSRDHGLELRIGAIDTAAAGLMPALLHDLRLRRPDITIHLVEDKTIRLLPRLLSGRLDLALIRPREALDKKLDFLFLFHETPVVAVATGHGLAGRSRLSAQDLVNEPLIVPDRRSRPHSHDVTMVLFREAGLIPNIVQRADEKQTIIGMVAAGLGTAIVPRWTARMATKGVRFIPIKRAAVQTQTELLPLAAAWVHGLRDPARDAVIDLLQQRLNDYGKSA